MLACVIATPAPHALELEWDPPLPGWKRDALAAVRYGQAAKLFLPLASPVQPSQTLFSLPGAIGQHIDRGLMLANQTFLVEFGSISNRIYYIQYSSDLKTWQTAQPAVSPSQTCEVVSVRSRV